MENLSEEDSWNLFCVYAFPAHGENRVPSHLEEVGRKIVKQCGNLPLAIKTTASSLANTTDLRKWESKRRQLERAVIPIGNHDPIDPEILVYLWRGEGFVPAGAGDEQWDTAWDWLDQLDQLCLLQLCEDQAYERLNRYCKIHDLLHDLAI
ncbi:hypothetical protein SUGI_0232330 [Cryptomeria japonica]|nr:hypothetical protein SUGI_0232330 [Cryptomeria japonica]